MKQSRLALSARQFHGDPFYLDALRDYEEMRALRNTISDLPSRPTEQQILQLRINKPWEAFYKSILNLGEKA